MKAMMSFRKLPHQSDREKYSDFIRYPIKMEETVNKPKEGSENEFEEVQEEQTVNSMVPIWRKTKAS